MKKAISMAAVVAMLWGVAAFAAKPIVPLGNAAGAGRNDSFHQTWDRTLSADTVYTLYGLYYVDSTYSLTVPAGTVIMGDTVGTLCVKRGAKGYFQGEPCSPIVMTSIQPPGNRSRGDWGGLVICGAAPTTRPWSTFIEGGIVKAQFGGPDSTDSSGEYRYLRVEYPGFRFQLNDEINGITLGAVGNGTKFHHVQVSYSYDDSYEFFGGTMDISYCIALGGTDDEYDTDFGYKGKGQFLFGLRDPFYWDAQGESRGFESDGDFSAPWTHPKYANVTLIGPRRENTTLIPPGTTFDWSAVPREGSRLSLFNSIIMGYPLGVSLRDEDGQSAACNDILHWENVSLQAETYDTDATKPTCTPPNTQHIHDESNWPCDDATCGYGVLHWFNNEPGCTSSDIRQPSSIGLTDMSDLTDPDPRPSPGSEPVTAGVSWTHPYLQIEGFFDQSPTYRGAFDPDLPMHAQWTRCWSNFDPQNTDYSDGVAPTAVGDGAAPRKDLVLENHPNPFNPTTTIHYSVPVAGHVTIQIFNVRGQRVATVLDREMGVGEFDEVFSATGLATGTYFLRITGNGFSKTSKMVLLK
jgi:hypothetical protein